MANEPRITLNLNPQGVIAPILRAIRDALDVMRVCVPAVQEFDFTQPASEHGDPDNSPGFTFVDRGDRRTPDEKQLACINWLLSKGFQEYARGVRGALEEAYVYNAVIEYVRSGEKLTYGDYQSARERASSPSRSFPQLMASVNEGLAEPLHFEEQFLSLQKVRNCLEHRGGRVSQRDAEEGANALVLSFPRLQIFYEKDGEEIELRAGDHIEADTVVKVRMVTERREFGVGKLIVFTPAEFNHIGMGCWAFADELVRKLPRPDA